MDLTEIRLAVLGGQTRVEEIRQFHRERVAAVIDDTVEGLDLAERTGILLHLIPLGAFDLGTRFDLGEAIRNDPDLRPMYSDPGYPLGRFNLDGIVAADTAFGDADRGAKEFVQVYRSGIIEAFDSYLLNLRADDEILGYPVERVLIDATNRFISLVGRIGVSPPILVVATIIGAGGRVIVIEDPRRALPGRLPVIDRAILPLPEIVVDALDVETSKLLRPMLDALWQAGGYPKSPNYDADGNWQRRDG